MVRAPARELDALVLEAVVEAFDPVAELRARGVPALQRPSCRKFAPQHAEASAMRTLRDPRCRSRKSAPECPRARPRTLSRKPWAACTWPRSWGRRKTLEARVAAGKAGIEKCSCRTGMEAASLRICNDNDGRRSAGEEGRKERYSVRR